MVYFLNNTYDPVLLEGGLMYSEKNLDNNTNSDTFDVGIMELTEELARKFLSSGYTFLELTKIQTSVDLYEIV